MDQVCWAVPDPQAPRDRADPPTRWYWLAGMLALLGLVGAVVWGGFRLLWEIEAPRDFVRAPIPGAVTVTVPGSTTQVVYVEGNRPLAVAALDLTVTGPTGAAVGRRNCPPTGSWPPRPRPARSSASRRSQRPCSSSPPPRYPPPPAGRGRRPRLQLPSPVRSAPLPAAPGPPSPSPRAPEPPPPAVTLPVCSATRRPDTGAQSGPRPFSLVLFTAPEGAVALPGRRRPFCPVRR